MEKIIEGRNCLADEMCRYIGQTVTVFTTSGGASGCGFTGVLISVDCGCIRLLNRIGEAPACAIGSSCCKTYGYKNCNCAYNDYNNPLGAITEIPICNIASFTHNAI